MAERLCDLMVDLEPSSDPFKFLDMARQREMEQKGFAGGRISG
eukprot:CAMPEP_0114049058 /NCGR_PEP_ID=MMETSP1339-20121228/53904_1 /TAXON_ID=94617 /ORGANISM="Fibrocapsa japonica" /LENGTH=42 /assembly_acc=CAM_ASM_000762